MGKKNLVSVTDFSCDEILRIMELAAQFEADAEKVQGTMYREGTSTDQFIDSLR